MSTELNIADFFTLKDDLTPPVATKDVSLERAYGVRPYQAEAIRKVEGAWTEGCNTKVLVVKATGTGKTPFMAILAKREVERGGRVLILAHTDELIDQARDKIQQFARIATAKEKANSYASRMERIVVGSVQTMCGVMRLSSWRANHFSLVLVDECFPAGTLIDGTPIEQIRVGDLVQCFDHARQRLVLRRVAHLFKSRAGELVKVSLSNGRSLICTPNHPVFVENYGYTPAAKIPPGSTIVFNAAAAVPVRGVRNGDPSERVLQQEHSEEYSMRSMQASPAEELPDNCGVQVQKLRQGRPVPRKAAELQVAGRRKVWPGLLLRGLRAGVRSIESLWTGREPCRVQSHTRTEEDAGKEPNVDARHKGEDGGKNGREDLSWKGRKRATDEAAISTTSCDSAADGACDRNGSGFWQIREPSTLLQGGLSGSGDEASYRGGREDAQIKEVEVFGSEEGGDLVGVRVGRVEILERGGGRRPGEVRADDYVYNLEVEEHHNYFADGVLVHNCHRSLAKSYQMILNKFHGGGAKIVGVTATADRGDKKELGDFYDTIAFEYNLRHAVRDGWLIRPVVETMPLEINLNGVHTKGHDLDQTEVGERLIPFLSQIAEQVKAKAPKGTFMFFMPSVETSRLMAAALNAVGIKSDWVSGDRPERRDVVKAFKGGRTQALCNMAVLTEGFDHDAIDTMVILRPTKIRSLFVQMAGRAARPLNEIVPLLAKAANAFERNAIIANSRKPVYKILDFLWLYEKHNLVEPASLVTSNPEVAKRMKGVDGDLMQAEERAEVDLLKKLEEEVKKNARKKAYVVDPLAVATESHDVELATYEPETANDAMPPTELQMKRLAAHGIDTSKIKWRGHASRIFLRIIDRHQQGLATFRQLHFMNQLGITDGAEMTREQATAAIASKVGKKATSA